MYLSKWGYTQRPLAEAVQISETHLNDFLQSKRGLGEVMYVKLEHVLSLNATQRKLQFYTGGNTGTRMCNLQAKGKNITGQIKFDSIDAIGDARAEFSKLLERKMEV